MDEYVVSPIALDEAVALLVREPLDSAFSQHFLLLQTRTAKRRKSNLRPLGTQGVRGGTGRLNRVPEQHRDRHRADATGHRVVSARPRRPPDRRPRRRPSPRFMPTSITVAPSRRRRPGPTPGLPDGDDEDVSLTRHCTRSRVREWQIVTVAFACRRSSDTGLPTMSLRPTTTAQRPPAARRTPRGAP